MQPYFEAELLAGYLNSAFARKGAKPQTALPLFLTTLDVFVIAGITLVAVPLLVVIIGVLVWARRRASYRPE